MYFDGGGMYFASNIFCGSPSVSKSMILSSALTSILFPSALMIFPGSVLIISSLESGVCATSAFDTAMMLSSKISLAHGYGVENDLTVLIIVSDGILKSRITSCTLLFLQ